MKPEQFVHLHCHSTYSLLEALPSPAEIVARAKELGQNTVGLADKGHMYGLIEFAQAAAKQDIKPILGMDVYIAARTRSDKESGIDTKSYPLTLLAETDEGYENLLQLATLSALEGMYYKPRVDDELLKKYGKGLIALTGPISAAIPQAALMEDGDKIKELTEKYQGFFGKENLYFELMELSGVSGQAEINQQLIHWGKELGVPLVATCNSHYCRTDDAQAHDVLLCIQKNAHVEDPGRFTMRDSDFSMRPFEEMQKAFEHVPEALENTRVIADRCNVDFTFGVNKIPRFDTPGNKPENEYLRELCEKGFVKHYPNPTEEERTRLDYELEMIDQMGFSGYFLIVADFVNEAKERGITVGPGRGSAAGSMVSYCLNITTLDPIEHGLLFERFLNPERVSMPDIDMDFADTRRDEVLTYVREKYGNDRVAQICTFGTLAARAAVKDVGRAYGIPFLEMNMLAKLIPERPGTKLQEALETSEMKAAYDSSELYRTIIDTALKLEGKARHVSVHACGVIITPEPAHTYTALQRAPKDPEIIITQYSAKPLESLGLLKMDFLGLMNLTVIQTTLDIVKAVEGTEIDIHTIPMDDEKAFALLQRGDTTGVFQFESGGMRRYLKQLKPTEFNDLTAMAALYRPGPMEWIPNYIRRKHGKEKVEYLHPDLEPILRETYGIGVYQEQILRLAREFAGFSLGGADLLRRAIGKKIKTELDAQREKFISGSKEKGYEKKLAEQIFDDVITPFAGYGFVKAHAACYARVAYETAYLKANFPAPFMAALLSSDAQSTDRVMIEIEECRAMGIAVLPPDINESFSQFAVIKDGENKGSIRFGLSAIKGVGESSVREIIEERKRGGKFESLEDFAKRMPVKTLNKKLLESLGKAGALDAFAERKTIIEHFATIVAFRKSLGDAGSMQADLFGGIQDDLPHIEFPETPVATPQEKLQWEKETLGLYVSSHPLAGLKRYIGRKANLLETLTRKQVGKKVKIGGIVEGIKKIQTKKGEAMAIIQMEDPSGKIEVTLFPRVYAQVSDMLESPDAVLMVEGVLDERAGMLQIRADSIRKSSLSAMLDRAKEQNLFSEEEAKQGMPMLKKAILEEEEAIEMVDEEGNVIAGETVKIEEKTEGTKAMPQTIAAWIAAGCDISEPLKKIGLASEKESKKEEANEATGDGTYTIALPERAPRQLLLDLKDILSKHTGDRAAALQIGPQRIELPIKVHVSDALTKQLNEVISKYNSAA